MPHACARVTGPPTRSARSQAEVAALARLLGVAQVPQHQGEVGERADAGVALRRVDVVGAIGSLVAGECLFQVLAGEVEVGQGHVDDAEVEVSLGEANGVVASLAERQHLVRQLERRPVLTAQQVEHPLPADHRHQPVVVAGPLARRPGPRVRVVDARGGIAVPRLERGREVRQEVDVLEIVTGVRIRLVERLQPAPEVLGGLQVGRSLERACSRGVPEVHGSGGSPRTGPVVGDDLGLSLATSGSSGRGCRRRGRGARGGGGAGSARRPPPGAARA